MYAGAARWDEIAAVKEALDIPVIGNGDIKTAADAVRMWQYTGCDGVMIARGAFGDPWIFQEARALLDGCAPRPRPGPAERFAVALRHAQLQQEIKGDDRRTAVEFRKHLGWYVRGLPGAADLRRRLHEIESMRDVERIFREYLGPVAAVG
jgi:tRNA-dihydrouridine synthase